MIEKLHTGPYRALNTLPAPRVLDFLFIALKTP